MDRVKTLYAALFAVVMLVAGMEVSAGFGRVPLSFARNKGQCADGVRYVVNGPKGSAAFKDGGVTFSADGSVFRLNFVGSDAMPQGMRRQPGSVNYINGSRSGGWVTGVPTYGMIVYRDVWPGIDIHFYGEKEKIKYDIIAAPGADATAIRLDYGPDAALKIDPNGSLTVSSGGVSFTEHIPLIYQKTAGGKMAVKGGYKIHNDGTLGFIIDNYDPALPLVIDPESDMAWSTFFGGASDDYASGIALDSSGNVYVAGCTHSVDFPHPGAPHDASFNGGTWDIFIAKMDPTGTKLIYSTYIGGSDWDQVYDLAVDSQGCAYITGYTVSTNYPVTTGAFDTAYGGIWDAYVTKLNSDGSALAYSTFIGGSGIETARGIRVDSDGSAYICGYTDSADFPVTPGAVDNLNEQIEAFVLKLNPQGSAPVYSTFFGGSALDYAMAIDLDESTDSAVIAGFTNSTNLHITPGAADDTHNGDWDAFAAVLDAAGTQIAYSTYLGGASSDTARAVASDNNGGIYLAGKTASQSFPTTAEAYRRAKASGEDAFITKIDTLSGAIRYSTYLGGIKDDSVNAIAVDQLGRAYVTGRTLSSDFPTTAGCFDNSLGGTQDAFITTLDKEGSSLVYSTFLGGANTEDSANGIVVSPSKAVYIAGKTRSADYPNSDTAWDKDLNGGDDVFIAKFGWSDIHPPTGSVKINSGASATNSTTAVLNITGNDVGTGVRDMCLSEDGETWGEWRDYAAEIPWTLQHGDGEKKAYVRFRDYDENISVTFNDAIILDTLPPSGAVIINNGDEITSSTAVTLGFTVSDSGSGVTHIRLSADGAAWGEWTAYAAALPYVIQSGDGSRQVFAQFKDGAGNISQSAFDTIDLVTNPPTGTLTINNGAEFVGSREVILALSAESASGVAEVRFSTGGDIWTEWEPFAPARSWTFDSGDGIKTVNAQFRDTAGKISLAAADTIYLDTAGPNGGLSINNGAVYTSGQSVTLHITAEDSASGVARARFSNDGEAWSDWETFASQKTWTIDSGDGEKMVYAELEDKVGNRSPAIYDSITLDSSAPSASVSVNSGDLYTANIAVVLSISASDELSGVTEMRVKNDSAEWSAWVSGAASKAWTLADSDGERLVQLQFRDAAGNISSVFSDSILLDRAGPTASITVNSGAQYTGTTEVTVGSDVSDPVSGPASARFSANGRDWGEWEAITQARAWSFSPGTGTRSVYAQFRDNAGNISSTVSDTIILDTASPTGSVNINSGAPYTNTAAVNLALAASDQGGTVAEVRFSNDGTDWGAWQPYALARDWSLTFGDGVKTVYAQFRDAAGNPSAVTSDTITVETVPPSGGISINAGAESTVSTSVTLTAAAADSESGVKQMRFSNDGLTWSNWENFAGSRLWTLLSGDGIKTVKAQFKDGAGNTSAVYSDTIQLDLSAPTGALSVNSGAAWASSRNAMLSVTAPDAVEMRLRNSGDAWGVWEPITTPKIWTLSPSDGLKTVYMQLKDTAGNVSADITDSISLDTTIPTGALLINSGAAAASSESVSINLTSQDTGSGVAWVRLRSDDAPWGQWQTFAPNISHTLAYGTGTKTVYAEFKDTAGNISAVASDTIYLDTSGQTGTIAINNGNRYTNSTAVTLSLSAQGAANMRFANDGGAWSAWASYAANASWILTPGDGPKTVLALFASSTGAESLVMSAGITLDTEAPVAAARINTGASVTSSPDVTVSIECSDALSGVSEMRIRNTGGTWSDWIAFASPIAWVLQPGDGERGIELQIKDAAGNESASTADSIRVDSGAFSVVSTSPSDGARSVVATGISAVFGKPAESASINSGTFTLKNSDGSPVAGSVAYDAATYTATFIPARPLDYDADYTAAVASGVTDSAGTRLAEDYVWSFRTAPENSDDLYEQNDSPAAAYDIDGSRGSWISTSGGSGVQADDDWYKVTLTHPTALIRADCLHTRPLGDIDIAVCNPDGSLAVPISGNPVSATGSDWEHVECALPAGVYLIRVYGANSGNAYDLRWDSETVQTQDGPRVLEVIPEDDAGCVGLDTPVEIRFDRPMNRELTQNAVVSSPALTSPVYNWSENDTILTITHAGMLGEIDYNFAVLATAKDADGLPLAAQHTWVFYTAPSIEFLTPEIMARTGLEFNAPAIVERASTGSHSVTFFVTIPEGISLDTTAGPGGLVCVEPGEDVTDFTASWLPDTREIMLNAYVNGAGEVEVIKAITLTLTSTDSQELTINGCPALTVDPMVLIPGDFTNDGSVNISDAGRFIQSWVRWHSNPLPVFQDALDSAFDLYPKSAGVWPDWLPIGDRAINIRDASAFIECWAASHAPHNSNAQTTACALGDWRVRPEQGGIVISAEPGSFAIEIRIPEDAAFDTTVNSSGNLVAVRQLPASAGLFFSEYNPRTHTVTICGTANGNGIADVAMVRYY